MNRKRRTTRKVRPNLGRDERLDLLRAEVARLDDTLEADESWRALRIFEGRSDRDSRDVTAARTRLEKALEANPIYRARARLADAIAILSALPLDLEGARLPAPPPLSEPVFLRPAKARGWYRSLTQSIAELAAPREGVEPFSADDADAEAEPRPSAAGGADPKESSARTPRSLDVEEAEVWIVDRSRRSPERP